MYKVYRKYISGSQQAETQVKLTFSITGKNHVIILLNFVHLKPATLFANMMLCVVLKLM